MPRHNPQRWQHSFEDTAILRDREKAARRHQPPPEDDTGTECARGDWCTAKVNDTDDDGNRITRPRRSPRPFCDPDRSDIAARIGGRRGIPNLPDIAGLDWLYAWLSRELLAPATSLTGRHGKAAAPPIPLRADVDALQHRIVTDLTAWWNRVAQLAGYTELPPLAPARRHRDGRNRVAHITDRLADGTNLDALLGLTPQWMSVVVDRPGIGESLPPAVLARYPGYQVVDEALSWVEIEAELDGTRAGLDILHMHYRCRSILGQTRPRPEPIVGIRCYQCSQTPALVRAEPPRYQDDIAYYSRCQLCGHRMTEPEYREHTERLAAMAGGRIVTAALD